MTIEEMKALAGETVELALSRGADTAEAGVSESDEFGVTVRNGEIENLSESGSGRINITVSVDKRKARASSSDLSRDGILDIIVEAVELASVMDRDEYFDLPDRGELGAFTGDLDIFDERSLSIPADIKIRNAFELEKAAVNIDSRIISDGASFSNGRYTVALANSAGFSGGFSQTYNSVEISCAASDGSTEGENRGKKQSSYWFSVDPYYSRLEPLDQVAAKAVERTIRKLGAVKPATCEIPVIFDPLTARAFLSSLASAVSGRSIYKKSSFLVNMLGKRIASPLVSVTDDPLLPGRLGSRPFDSEGVLSRRNTVIESGILKSYLLDSYQGRKLSMKTTGNCGGTSNFHMSPGASSIDEMIASMDEGLFLTSLSGPGANWSTGDFSQGAQGIWISGGRLAYPVNEFTVAGTFTRILEGISMVSDEVLWKGSFAAPAFKTDSLTVSGT